MATVKFYYRSKKDNGPITLRLVHGSEFDYFINTQLRIDRPNWNTKKGFPKTTDEKSRDVKNKLNNLENAILQAFSTDYNQGLKISKVWLSKNVDIFFSRYASVEGPKIELIENIDRIIRTAHIRKNGKGGIGLSNSRINAYRNLKRIIQNYETATRRTLTVRNINLAFVSDFVEFMQSQNYHPGNIQKKISDIKTVCLDALSIGLETHPQLSKVTGYRVKNDYIVYLTEEELHKIEHLSLENPSLINAKKWLLLGSMIGQRGGDLLNLTEKNISNRGGLKLIELVQQKGNKHVVIPLSSKMDILLKDGFPYKISIQKFNIYLKQLCQMAEINEVVEGSLFDNKIKRKRIGHYEKWKLISSHDLRRTFASNTYGEMPTPLIMSITGHATEKTFLKYIGKTSIDYAQQIAEYYTKKAIKDKVNRDDGTNQLKAILKNHG